MRVNVILRYVGMIMLLLAFFMFVSAGISYINHMDSAFYPLLLSALLTALLGGFPLVFVEKQDRITNKEGFCIVVGSWLLACVVGMFPYLIWGGEFSVINALRPQDLRFCKMSRRCPGDCSSGGCPRLGSEVWAW